MNALRVALLIRNPPQSQNGQISTLIEKNFLYKEFEELVDILYIYLLYYILKVGRYCKRRVQSLNDQEDSSLMTIGPVLMVRAPGTKGVNHVLFGVSLGLFAYLAVFYCYAIFNYS